MAHKILGPLLVVVIAACGGGDATRPMSAAPAAAEPARPERNVTISTEAPRGFAPDLGGLSYDPGDVVAGVEAAGVATLLQGAAYTLADTYDQITALGAITGDVDEAAALVAGMQSEMAELAASVQELSLIHI